MGVACNDRRLGGEQRSYRAMSNNAWLGFIRMAGARFVRCKNASGCMRVVHSLAL